MNEAETTLKRKIEESIKTFHQLYEKFISSKNGLNLKCHNHIQEVRFQLDLHREKLKEKIDEICIEMIEKTKKIEASYLKRFLKESETSLEPFEIKNVDEKLNASEVKFRDPNLLIESIQEINLKQKESIDKIQSNLNEIRQINEHLKSNNEFKPSMYFNQDLFGELSLNYYSSSDPFKSQILTGRQQSELIKLCEFNPQYGFKLLYRASEHGFGSKVFHSKCDGHANTLTILKASESSFIFVGFTKAIWDDSADYRSDPNAFLFSLTNKDNKPYRMKIDPYAIFSAFDCGPSFGLDISICSDSNKNTNSFSDLEDVYKHPRYAFETNEAETHLAGSYKFQLSEIEVYQKEDWQDN